MEKYVTLKEVASVLQISKSTIYQWTHIGFIPHYKVGGLIRFKLTEIEIWMKRRKVRGREQRKIEVDL